ncbi:O-antigen ligase family protein [Blastopirellula sp. JC732]|uniref:O-antigen ligase family protein n=1 Tax=Blastopirellula sediminis TaxID=2894196 RepID=A0A9X1MKH8_9BACT|nr:O-antigen ligase family protein [Blastopirellula sediminis]MCC9608053.1 O-antigen ligase family protein [Blastopirellula sediminis]MCC9627154.1 O-antigen ligase family protein [Blastopirellula sediminis]
MSHSNAAALTSLVDEDGGQLIAKWFPIVSIWALGLLCFSLPGRLSPEGVSSVDLIAVGKLGARALIVLVAAWILIQRKLDFRAGAPIWAMTPLLFWLGWSVLSVFWSPLLIVSVGQVCGMAAILLLAAVIGCGPASALPNFVSHTLWMLFAASLATLLLHLVNPELSGLDRALDIPGSDGFVHPTAAGATASLGLVLGVLARFVWPRNFTSWAASSTFVVHFAVLILASSRSAFAAGAVVCVAIAIWSIEPRKLGWPLLLLGAGILGYMLLDPGFRETREILSLGIGYMQRGQTVTQLKDFSGRLEMWEAVGAEFSKSPWIGHGYFCTSAEGKLFVWNSWSNPTAHNILLQLLATGGIVGTLLFLWGMCRAFGKALLDVVLAPDNLTYQPMIAFLLFWYLIWTFGCVSFIGPIRPESVVFALILGIAIHPYVRESDGGEQESKREHLPARLAAYGMQASE